ncbi:MULTISPECIES: DUF899 domain-containing protein [Paenibacillus]|uniref:DUF899 domain-containing protein n=1 Tax=Paenibacillus suaedae TaxID=3077233 RepID=A0AAJ2N5P8_9BACL|nr:MULTISPECIES: DUF899 domain-containing protein [Paenibacillus]MDT8977850.1 DUF899 domain-containing protein [Paenibacillus sp. chi10]GAV12844.1 hypothetical protein PBN151_2777 [Paenibacillus sp. NAIST15-1]
MSISSMPRIVSEEEWQIARQKLLVREKELTRELDALAAERRRLPMVRIEKDYVFEGSNGTASLLDLFEGRRQLIIYHFMMSPGSDHRCRGCSSFVDNIGHLSHLHARDTSFILVSPAPFTQIESFRKHMGWTIPWYSSNGDNFNFDCGAGKGFGLSIFLRNDDSVFRTYYTTARGVDRIRADFNLLDLTPYGRQEEWEDSPKGWPQTPPYTWWRLHDEYEVNQDGK